MTANGYRSDPDQLDWIRVSSNVARLGAERDTARNRIIAVIRAVHDSQANGQTVTSNAAILAALEADQ